MCIKHDAESGERCKAKRVLLEGGKEIGLIEKQNSLSHSWYHEHVRLKADFFQTKKHSRNVQIHMKPTNVTNTNVTTTRSFPPPK